jgi:hypothetical protein
VSRSFEQLVDVEGLTPELSDRLRGVHNQLVAAGPPPELTPALLAAPSERGGSVLPLRTRRRQALTALAFAAAVAVAAFGGGFLLGHARHAGMKTVTVVPMQGEQNSLASIRVGRADANGNWPIEFTVTGLPKQPNSSAYYILILEQNGKPRFNCGTFRVSQGTTTVHFTVPYRITKSSEWVVTEMTPGKPWPGHVVMTTT